jgi:hypothetical protein
MADTVIYAMYDDDDVLKEGAKKLVSKGVRVTEVFSPFPIHGIDPIIGIKNTRLGIMAFLYGITGLMLATIGMNYFMIQDWPMNIGGKPSFSYLENFLAFVPITFEFTVLCAAHGMAITYLLVVIELRLSENHNFTAAQLEAMLKDTGIVEIDQKEIK